MTAVLAALPQQKSRLYAGDDTATNHPGVLPGMIGLHCYPFRKNFAAIEKGLLT